MLPQIIFEDYYLLVFDKPAGLCSDRQHNQSSAEETVEAYLAHRNKNYYCGLVHRIDKPVSGLIVFAKTKQAHRDLARQFEQGTVQRFYTAWVENKPPLQHMHLQNFLGIDEKSGRALIVASQKKSFKKAELTFDFTEEEHGCFKLNVQLHTGRFHQIRAQLAHAGMPIAGDELYGAKRVWKDGKIALIASQLHITHPKSGAVLQFESKCVFSDLT